MSGGEKAHLGATVDGLSEPDVLLGLGASEPVLLGDALRVGIDAGLTGGEVAEDLDGVVHAALVGVDPVESYEEKQEETSKWGPADITDTRSRSRHGPPQAEDEAWRRFELTTGPLRVAELDVTAGAGRVLPGSLGREQVVDLSVEGLDGGINLVVLGSQSRLISSVLIVSRKVISATGSTGRSRGTGRTRGTLVYQRKDWFGCASWILVPQSLISFTIRTSKNVCLVY